MLYLKIGFLFVAILFTITNVIRMIAKNNISAANIVYHAIGVTGFVVLQWII